MRRDREILRLTKYAEGMGLKVTFSADRSVDACAEWSLDGTEITIYTQQHDSKTGIILSLIHEIAHHLWFIHEKNRKPDLKFEEAVHKELLAGQADSKVPISKVMRRRIYKMEQASTAWWDAIYKETDLGIPIWKLHLAMEYDVWHYQVYYKEGLFPKGKRSREKFKELKQKYQPEG